MFSLTALVLLLSLHSAASFSYLTNLTWREANETCDLATPPITDWNSFALELPNIPDEYRDTCLWTGYYNPNIVIENIGCMLDDDHKPTTTVTRTPLTEDTGSCFNICRAFATIGIQRKGSILNCYCLTDEVSPHDRSVKHCTHIQESFLKPYYGGKENQIALYRKAENRSVSDEDTTGGCVAYDIAGKEYVYKPCTFEIGVFCQNSDGDAELRPELSWKEGAKHCIDISSVLPIEITPGLLGFLPNDSQVTHIWTRLQGKHWIMWEKPAITTPVKWFVCLQHIGGVSYMAEMRSDMRINAICNDPLPNGPTQMHTYEQSFYAWDQSRYYNVISSTITGMDVVWSSLPYQYILKTMTGQTNLYTYIGISVGVVFLVVAVVVVILLVRRKVNRT